MCGGTGVPTAGPGMALTGNMCASTTAPIFTADYCSLSSGAQMQDECGVCGGGGVAAAPVAAGSNAGCVRKSSSPVGTTCPNQIAGDCGDDCYLKTACDCPPAGSSDFAYTDACGICGGTCCWPPFCGLSTPL